MSKRFSSRAEHLLSLALKKKSTKSWGVYQAGQDGFDCTSNSTFLTNVSEVLNTVNISYKEKNSNVYEDAGDNDDSEYVSDNVGDYLAWNSVDCENTNNNEEYGDTPEVDFSLMDFGGNGEEVIARNILYKVEDILNDFADVSRLDETSEIILEEELLRKKRLRTEEEKCVDKLEKYKLLPACLESCRQKCREKFDEHQRNAINRCYRLSTFKERKIWFQSMIKEIAIARMTEGSTRRKTTLTYNLPTVTGRNKLVCKTMFLRTLGMATDGQITSFLKARNKTLEEKIAPLDDKHGKHPAAHKADSEKIREHINSYHRVVSHYAREKAPNRRYLYPDLSIQVMWKDYVEANSCTYETY